MSGGLNGKSVGTFGDIEEDEDGLEQEYLNEGEECPECEGTGDERPGVGCEACDGTGVVYP